jgi:glycosyltransferase involved in cell wall biosynthesis
MSENKICCIFNLAPHYRTTIYTMMDRELSCDFYFGDKVESKMKIMDVQQLSGYKRTVQNKRIIFNRFWWQKGVVHLAFKKQYKYFILTGDSSVLSSWFIILFCLLLRKKTFIWMHGLQSEPSWKGKLITYPFYWMANKFLLYGEHAKHVMIELGFSEKKIECIYNSLNYDHQLSIREKLQKTNIYSDFFGNNLPTLIYIGRIQKVKKIEQLFEAIRLLEERKVYCNLMLIGENTDCIDLQNLYVVNKLQSKLWIYGSCYNENKIAEFFYNAEVCVSPGNIGLTAIHAISYGTPCITHDNYNKQMPEFEAIQNCKTGYYFKENNISDLSDKIEKCISYTTIEREEVRNDCYAIIDEKYNTRYQINLLKKLLN